MVNLDFAGGEKYGDQIGMAMHDGLLVGSIMDFENSYLVVLADD
jgi:hypothetical protein